MALLNHHLLLWEIGFRWAGKDPDRLWMRIPLPVRDHFRVLMDAVLHGHLDCVTLSLEKWYPEKQGDREFFIRHYMDQVYECIGGVRFDRKLLKWAVIERWAMQQWCERQGVPLPEFWFPPGWKIEYQRPEDEDDEPSPGGERQDAESVEEKKIRLDKWHRIRMACQQVALFIWSKEPKLTIKQVALRTEIQDMAGGSEAELETVEEWIGKVDPRNPANKRGPKRKNNSPPGDSAQ